MDLQNYIVHKLDRKEFDSEIRPEMEAKKELNIFCSFTYITPNYSVLFTLNELKKFVDSGNHKVFIVIWDMNTLANPYFKKMCSSRKISEPESFIGRKILELKEIAQSIGFDKEKLLIYKSSELWKRFISYKEENIFQEFYSVLAQMKIKDYVANNKTSHLFQIPMDIFFCNYFHKLCPEDTNKPMDLVFFGQDKENLYTSTRRFMLNDGLIENKNPVFIMMKYFPYLLYNHALPEWNMSLKDIKNILRNHTLTKKEIFTLFRHISSYKDIRVKSDKGLSEFSYKDFFAEYEKRKASVLIDILAENLFSYLKEHRKKYMEHNGKIEESILKITEKKDVKNIGKVLKSNIALDILLLADGLKNTSQMAKILEKSVATVSTYANRLKKMKLIRVLPNGKLKRNIKGVKINFELGI